MSSDSILTQIMRDVPSVLAAGIVDLASGMLIGVKTVDKHPPEILELVAAATKDMFEGPNITAIEDMFKRARGIKTDERYCKELIMTSSNLLHVFSRLSAQQSIVIVAVCRGDTNTGLALMKMRGIAAKEMV